MSEFFSNLPQYQLIAFLALLLLFGIQTIYWFGYKLVSRHRHHHRLRDDQPLPPVSVIVVVEDDPEYIYEELPKLLTQDHPQYEVIVVNDCGGAEVTEALMTISNAHSNLRYTVIKADDRFKHSRKIALMVGIKAAQYENIIFTHTDTHPTSERWLSFMAKGFVGSDIVISYCGYEPKAGLTAKLIRSSHLMKATRYLRAATKGHAYRADMRNMGYTKKIFFANRGFTHLRLALGEDDLLIQKIANQYNTAVIINPHCTTRATPPANRRQWRKLQKYFTYSFRYYRPHVKITTFVELLSRALFFTIAPIILAAGILALPAINLISEYVAYPIFTLSFAAGMIILRETIMLNAIKNICNRLGEKGLMISSFIYDKVAPITQATLAISRRIKPPLGLWK